jgi:hypothetical protein
MTDGTAVWPRFAMPLARPRSARALLPFSLLISSADGAPVTRASGPVGASSWLAASALAASTAACMRSSTDCDNTGRPDEAGADRASPGTRRLSGWPSSSTGRTPLEKPE